MNRNYFVSCWDWFAYYMVEHEISQGERQQRLPMNWLASGLKILSHANEGASEACDERQKGPFHSCDYLCVLERV